MPSPEPQKPPFIVCGTPTANDLVTLAEFRTAMSIRREAKAQGLSERDATRYAMMEVYGNETGQ